MIFTNYFIPEDRTLVKLIKKHERIATNTDNLTSNDESKDEEILEAGFYDGCTENDKYLNLLERTGWHIWKWTRHLVAYAIMQI